MWSLATTPTGLTADRPARQSCMHCLIPVWGCALPNCPARPLPFSIWVSLPLTPQTNKGSPDTWFGRWRFAAADDGPPAVGGQLPRVCAWDKTSLFVAPGEVPPSIGTRPASPGPAAIHMSPGQPGPATIHMSPGPTRPHQVGPGDMWMHASPAGSGWRRVICGWPRVRAGGCVWTCGWLRSPAGPGDMWMAAGCDTFRGGSREFPPPPPLFFQQSASHRREKSRGIQKACTKRFPLHCPPVSSPSLLFLSFAAPSAARAIPSTVPWVAGQPSSSAPRQSGGAGPHPPAAVAAVLPAPTPVLPAAPAVLPALRPLLWAAARPWRPSTPRWRPPAPRSGGQAHCRPGIRGLPGPVLTSSRPGSCSGGGFGSLRPTESDTGRRWSRLGLG